VINESGGILPYTCEQAFDLAADIERYPEFLRGWISARLLRRESNVCYVDQVVGLGPVRLQFTSRAVLHRPERIDVTSTEAPFRLFSLSWRISPVASAACRVGVVAEIELQSKITQRIVNQIMPAAMDDIIAAFAARAHRVYGVAGPANRG
jgi:coenzyme Q-binding protein COQ10